MVCLRLLRFYSIKFLKGFSMLLTTYEQEVLRTCSVQTIPDHFFMACLGLAGEVGELTDLFKKHLFHGHTLDREKAILELGDVLWYATELAHALESDLETVLEKNVEKLRARYPDGFSVERSHHQG